VTREEALSVLTELSGLPIYSVDGKVAGFETAFRMALFRLLPQLIATITNIRRLAEAKNVLQELDL